MLEEFRLKAQVSSTLLLFLSNTKIEIIKNPKHHQVDLQHYVGAISDQHSGAYVFRFFTSLQNLFSGFLLLVLVLRLKRKTFSTIVFRPDGSGKHNLGDATYFEASGNLVNETRMEVDIAS